MNLGPWLENEISEDVFLLQEGLSKSEKAWLIVDGVYGPRTMAAVAAWQEQTRLPVTGVADHKMLLRLDVTHEKIEPHYVDAMLARLDGRLRDFEKRTKFQMRLLTAFVAAAMSGMLLGAWIL